MARTISYAIRLTYKALKRMYSYLVAPITRHFTRRIPHTPIAISKGQWRTRVLEKIRRRSKNIKNQAKSQLSQAEYLSLSLEELGCSICLQTIIFPTSVPCGHAFCLKCLDQSLSIKSQCPNCRSSIAGQDYSTNQSLSQALNTILPHIDPLIRTNYEKRVAEVTVWRDKREVNCLSIKPDMLLDIKDSQNIWCKARVLQTYPDQSILIHFQRWASHYDEIIELPSWRLAQPGFYTDRKEVIHYDLPDLNHMTARLVRSESQQRRAHQLYIFNHLITNPLHLRQRDLVPNFIDQPEIDPQEMVMLRERLPFQFFDDAEDSEPDDPFASFEQNSDNSDEEQS